MPDRRTRAQIAGHDARFGAYDDEFERLRTRLSGTDTRVSDLRRDTAQRFALQDSFNADAITAIGQVRRDVVNVRTQVDNVGQMVDWRPSKLELAGWIVLGLILGAIAGLGGVYALNSYYDMSWSEFAKWRDVVVMALIGAVLGRIIGGNIMRRRYRKAVSRATTQNRTASREGQQTLSWQPGGFPTERLTVDREAVRL